MSRRTQVKRLARKRRREKSQRLRDLREKAVAEYHYGGHGGALARAKKVLDERPRDHDALQVLYRSALKLQDLAALVEHAEHLLEIEDDLGLTAGANIGIALFRHGRHEEARRVLEGFLARGPRVEAWRREAKTALRLIEAGSRKPALDEGPPESEAETPPPPPAEDPSSAAAGPTPPKQLRLRRPGAPELWRRSVAVTAAEGEPPVYRPRVNVAFLMPPASPFLDAPSDPEGVRLRTDIEHARLMRGFDELICLKAARDLDHYWYQIETVKRALKRFRGRVLLADEVGLGKTVEAAMIATEYVLRGLVRRILVLVPASLVAQWREEFSSKFGLEFDDAREHRAEPGYWARAERVVASVALARSPRHFAAVASSEWDLVIVDEAHRLKNRRTKGWALVNSLRPRFLLMLSATPVQNDLVELYNLVTLLKPGLLGTEAEFKRMFLRRGEVRDVDGLRGVLANVMVRNTRGLIDAKLPNRFAETFVVEPSGPESEGLRRAQELVRQICREGAQRTRMAGQQLLLQAGSSPAALAAALERFAARKDPPREDANELARRLSPLGAGEKGRRLVGLIRARPQEKIVVFVQFTKTLRALDSLLEREGIPRAAFTGSMTPDEKEGAIARFREEVNILLSTGSGGEGRNLQFARTVVNFDLPWNPMRIEQRVGRVHRLGQKRDVFVFNFALRGSIEERLLDLLGRKMNLFEMVVGEIDEILGDLEGEFGRTVFELWLEATDERALERGFDDLGRRLVESRERYRSSTEFGERLFGEDLAP